MRFLALISFALFSAVSYGQQMITSLGGFGLGQFREVPKNELKEILQQDRFEDGFEYEIYLVEEDSSVYMIFEYANYDLQTIWSIQLTGSKKGFDCSFADLRLGMTEKEIVRKLGEPSSIEDAGEYGERWIYGETNFTIEVSPAGLLGGVKIIDMSRDFYPNQDLAKIPNFSRYTEILQSKNRTEVAQLLAPGIEIYKGDTTYFFRNSLENEIEADQSEVFRLVSEMANKLDQIDPNDSLQYEENMRVSQGQDTKHVAKFYLNDTYSEIVFKYVFGRYLIWEIKME